MCVSKIVKLVNLVLSTFLFFSHFQLVSVRKIAHSARNATKALVSAPVFHSSPDVTVANAMSATGILTADEVASHVVVTKLDQRDRSVTVPQDSVRASQESRALTVTDADMTIMDSTTMVARVCKSL